MIQLFKFYIFLLNINLSLCLGFSLHIILSLILVPSLGAIRKCSAAFLFSEICNVLDASFCFLFVCLIGLSFVPFILSEQAKLVLPVEVADAAFLVYY